MNTGICFYYSWEPMFIEALQQHMGPLLTKLASFMTLFGEEFIMVAVMGFFYWSYDKRIAKRLCINVMCILALAPMIKNLVFRRRPYFDNPEVICLDPVENGADIYDIEAQGFSFPSAHSACAAALYPTLALYIKRNFMGVFAVVIPLLVGISRFCLGVHYPTDVFAGWAIGLLVAIAVSKLTESVKNEDLLYVILLVLGSPGLFYCSTTDYYTGYGLFAGCVAAFIFESKYVNFNMTRKPLYMVLRPVIGIAVFLACTQGLKILLPASYMTRVIRYAVGAFVSMAIYPMVFSFTEREKRHGA